jgi:hypothetical protein
MNELWNYPIWQIKTDFNKKFNNDLVDEIYSISQELKNDLNPKDSLWDYHRPNLSILKTKIDSCINTIAPKDIPEIKELNYSFNCGMGWVNVKEPGEDIELHAHPDCSFAATYYVKTPENCGDLVCYVKDGKKLRIKPEEGVIVILPFYILHEIESNQSSDLRISISTDFLQIPDKTVKDALVIKSWLHQMVKTKEWNFVN